MKKKQIQSLKNYYWPKWNAPKMIYTAQSITAIWSQRVGILFWYIQIFELCWVKSTSLTGYCQVKSPFILPSSIKSSPSHMNVWIGTNVGAKYKEELRRMLLYASGYRSLHVIGFGLKSRHAVMLLSSDSLSVSRCVRADRPVWTQKVSSYSKNKDIISSKDLPTFRWE